MAAMELVILILLTIVVIGVVNEKWIHLQSDIALVLFSVAICAVLLILSRIPGMEGLGEKLKELGSFDFEKYLMDFVLCFMLFAGASKVNLHKFRTNIKPVCLLALLTTIISSVLYGALFYLAARLAGIRLDIWVCILLGCIVSPTDPIAATGILNKLGLSKNVTSVIESESLFNDGTGVALFVFVKSIVSQSGESNFLLVMLKEVLGALAVAFAVSFLLFRLMKLTKNPTMQILISVLDVSVVYLICEKLGFSGVIASVVCGMYMSYQMGSISRRREVTDPENLYDNFWDIIDHILNAVLFVLIAISFLGISFSSYIWFVLPAGIICVIISRFVGVWTASAMLRRNRIPGGYSMMEFVTLMTWCALKGGLSLALAMSTKEFLDTGTYLVVLNAAYATIFFTVLVQGLTIKRVYGRLEAHKAKRLGMEAVKRRAK